MYKVPQQFSIMVVLFMGAGCSASYLPEYAALEALQSDYALTITKEKNFWSFIPTGKTEELAFIFYPGGKVDPRAYATTLRPIAEAGHPTFLLKAPLDLAIFGRERASSVIDSYPDIERWAVGGHSLGGVAAAAYADDHNDEVEALSLWASFPAGSRDLSDLNLRVNTLYGSEDGLLDEGSVEASLERLPSNTLVQVIKGGNHAQFGSYGVQEGDLAAEITPEAQQALTAESVLALLENKSGELP